MHVSTRPCGEVADGRARLLRGARFPQRSLERPHACSGVPPAPLLR
ncbi:hypothetical protein ACF061_37740 [Streptomyces sp. NPDC015220]